MLRVITFFLFLRNSELFAINLKKNSQAFDEDTSSMSAVFVQVKVKWIWPATLESKGKQMFLLHCSCCCFYFPFVLQTLVRKDVVLLSASLLSTSQGRQYNESVLEDQAEILC